MSPISNGCNGEVAKTQKLLRIRTGRKLNLLNHPDDIPVTNDRPTGTYNCETKGVGGDFALL